MSFRSDNLTDSVRLAPYLPAAILSWYAKAGEGEIHRVSRQTGMLVCVDVSGFTSLTNALAGSGKSGKEQLTRILNELFEGLCRAVQVQNGDVLKFAGDALWVDLGEDPDIRQFLTDCLDSVAHVNECTSFGSPVELQVHIGAEYGEYDLVSFGQVDSRLEIEPVGRLVETVFLACDHAGRNSMILGPVAASRVRDLNLTTKDDKWYSTEEWKPSSRSFERPALLSVGSPAISIHSANTLSRYVVAETNQRLSGTRGQVSSHSEHREVTLLFVYVEFAGSVTFAEQLPEESVAHMYFRELFEIVSHCRGTVARLDPYGGGHKALILFGAPIKREHDELNAISAALRIRELATNLCTIRIGASFGSLFCGDVGSSFRREYTVMGNSVNLAARLMALAHEGKVLLDDQLRQRLPPSIVSEAISAQVKGIQGTVQCHRLIGTRESAVDIELPVLSPEQAGIVSFMRDAWSVAQGGSLQKMLCRGGSGVGKTSILRTFRKEVPLATWIGCRDAVLHEQGWVLRKFLQALFGDFSSANLAQIFRSRIEPAWLPLFCDLSDQPTEENEWTRGLTKELREQKRAELLQTLLTEMVTTPTVILLDDFDKADERSRETIETLTESARAWPLLVVQSEVSIPGEDEPKQTSSHVHIATVKQPTKAFWYSHFGALLGEGKREQELVARMLEASGGNPRHLAELMHLLRSSGQLEYSAVTEKWEMLQSSVVTTLPSTISDLYLSQLDQLPEPERQLLKCASVSGETITREFLGIVLPERCDDSVMALLESLEKNQILKWHHGAGGYQFVDASMRDAVYNCLPQSVAIAIHCQIADHLLSSQQARPELCSHHTWHGERWREAFAYSLEAGTVSLGEHSLLKAAELLHRCHWILLTKQEVVIPVDQRMTFYRTYAQLLDIEGRAAEYAALLRLWRRDGDQSGLHREGCQAAIETARLLWKKSRYRMTKRVLDQVIKHAAILHTSEIESDGRLLLAEVYRRTGDFPRACESAMEGLALALRIHDQPKITDGQNKLGLAYWGMGKLAEAADCFEKSLASLAARESRYLTAKATNNLGIVLWESGRYQEAICRLEEAAGLFRFVGDRRNEAYSRGNLAGLVKLLGQFSKSEQLYRQACVIFERLGDRHAYHYTQGNLGDLALIRGDIDSAGTLFSISMAFAQEAGDQELQAECNIRFGEMAYYTGDLELSQVRFECAKQQSTVIGSTEFLLRALVGSARRAVGVKDLAGLDDLIHQIEQRAKSVPGTLALFEATFLRGEFYRLTGETDKAKECFREVRSYAVEQDLFELRLKSNCRLFELDFADTLAATELKNTAQRFNEENTPMDFMTLLRSEYFKFFAKSVSRALEQ